MEGLVHFGKGARAHEALQVVVPDIFETLCSAVSSDGGPGGRQARFAGRDRTLVASVTGGGSAAAVGLSQRTIELFGALLGSITVGKVLAL